MYTSVHILHWISGALKRCGVEKLGINIAEKDVIFKEKLMFSNDPWLFFNINEIKKHISNVKAFIPFVKFLFKTFSRYIGFSDTTNNRCPWLGVEKYTPDVHLNVCTWFTSVHSVHFFGKIKRTQNCLLQWQVDWAAMRKCEFCSISNFKRGRKRECVNITYI